ncbi:hypothetical protein Agub_g10556, partial [Astrephomene gubernaculifera]
NRELRLLEPFGWDPRRTKHPANLDLLGVPQRRTRQGVAGAERGRAAEQQQQGQGQAADVAGRYAALAERLQRHSSDEDEEEEGQGGNEARGGRDDKCNGGGTTGNRNHARQAVSGNPAVSVVRQEAPYGGGVVSSGQAAVRQLGSDARVPYAEASTAFGFADGAVGTAAHASAFTTAAGAAALATAAA